jgi:hypothetical protein
MADGELISRDQLLRFWQGLDGETQRALKRAAEEGEEVPPELVSVVSQVMGSVGTKWGDNPDWSFWMTRHLREFLESLPPGDTSGELPPDVCPVCGSNMVKRRVLLDRGSTDNTNSERSELVCSNVNCPTVIDSGI